MAARLDEAAKGRRQEQQKRERAQREADAARAQSNQLLAELMQAQTVASKLREKETNLKRDLRRLRGRGLSGLEVEELASLERDLRAALRRVTLAKEKRLKASVHVPDGYVCPITRELMRDPVFCGDGHTYEREAISVWLMTKDTSPKTGCVLETKALIPNFALRSAIDDLRNRRRLADEYDAYVAEHGDDIEDGKPGYYGLRRVADMGYLEVARRLFDGAGATCMLSGGGAVPYFQSCTGCALADALQCVADMRANVSLNVPVGCDLGAVASQPDRGTAYSEPWIEDSFQQTWPHARRDPETLLDGEDPVIRRYPREDVDGTEYRYRAATSPQADRLRGDKVALDGAQTYQNTKQQEEANLLLAAEYERQRDNRRCCARKRQYNTYAYPCLLYTSPSPRDRG